MLISNSTRVCSARRRISNPHAGLRRTLSKNGLGALSNSELRASQRGGWDEAVYLQSCALPEWPPELCYSSSRRHRGCLHRPSSYQCSIVRLDRASTRAQKQKQRFAAVTHLTMGAD